MASSREENQEDSVAPILTEPLRVRIHWTAVVSFVLGLFFVLFGAIAGILSVTDVGRGLWNWIVSTSILEKLAPVLYAVAVGSVLYALAGWIFGLVAFGVARRPAWRKGFALATLGLSFAVVLCVVLVGIIVVDFLAVLRKRRSKFFARLYPEICNTNKTWSRSTRQNQAFMNLEFHTIIAQKTSKRRGMFVCEVIEIESTTLLDWISNRCTKHKNLLFRSAARLPGF